MQMFKGENKNFERDTQSKSSPIVPHGPFGPVLMSGLLGSQPADDVSRNS